MQGHLLLLWLCSLVSEPLATNPSWTAEGNRAGAYFGWPVASAGDVNGDGFSDVIVGAPRFDNGEAFEGKAFVYLGSATGLALTPAWTAESNQVGAEFGDSVASAGDVNGDGFSDIIVGAFGFSNGESNEGRAFVYLGSASGPALTPAWTAESNKIFGWFGNSVASAGDVNGDGFSDVIVGAWNNPGARAFVYLGSSSGLALSPTWTADGAGGFGMSVSSAGDVNGDGFYDVIVGASGFSNGESDEGGAFVYLGSAAGLAPTPAWTAESNQAGALLGGSVASAGDVNGDGFFDVIVGAVAFDNGEIDEGRAFVYLGSASGPALTPAWTAESNQATAYFGNQVASVGDVNGDGFSDVIVGAECFDNGEADEGRAFVYLGSSAGLATNPTWTAESNQASAHFGRFVASAGDVNGNIFSDVIVGAYQFASGESDEGQAFVYLGGSTCSQASTSTYGVGKPGLHGLPQLTSVPPSFGTSPTLLLSNTVTGLGVLFV
ncbi:MAG: FG-GAP repeat protein, partial [Planctomycetes bacterium]|nr:FG-GAP repeat protein [Planctomycetota bacterium]